MQRTIRVHEDYENNGMVNLGGGNRLFTVSSRATAQTTSYEEERKRGSIDKDRVVDGKKDCIEEGSKSEDRTKADWEREEQHKGGTSASGMEQSQKGR
ncbi:hypothetical protein J6590_094702 [Homalodisca vitripennis]|nr:hypothetical protein J6590_094702 [Homalodisca vitripennis]